MMSSLRNQISAKFKISLISCELIIFMTLLIDATGFGIIFPLLPFYAETFNMGSAALSVLYASFALMQFLFSPVLGKISDKIGRKPVLIISILTSLGSFILFSFANSFLLLLLSRISSGIATEGAVAQAYIADITNKNERASGMGKVGAAQGAGFILGPAMGGFLSSYGFSIPGLAAVLLTIINLIFVILFLPESLQKKNTPHLTSNSNESFFYNILKVLRKPRIGAVLLIGFISFMSFSALPVVGPLLSSAFFGFGPSEASYIFMYIGAIQIILQGIIIGKLSKKFGEEKLLTFCPLLLMLGMFLMPIFPYLSLHLIFLTMVSSGVGIMRTIVPSYISNNTPSQEQGGILGITNSISSMATIPGPLIGGFLCEYAGIATPFFTSAAILMIAFLIGLKLFIFIKRY